MSTTLTPCVPEPNNPPAHRRTYLVPYFAVAGSRNALLVPAGWWFAFRSADRCVCLCHVSMYQRCGCRSFLLHLRLPLPFRLLRILSLMPVLSICTDVAVDAHFLHLLLPLSFRLNTASLFYMPALSIGADVVVDAHVFPFFSLFLLSFRLKAASLSSCLCYLCRRCG